MSSFNGSGTFNISGVGLPYTSGTTISSAVANQLNTDLATGLSNCITKDGQQSLTANIPFNNYKATGLANGTATADAATIANLQNATGTLLSVTGTNTIVGTATPAITSYVAGMTFRFFAAATNTGAVTLNVSGLGAKAITKNGTTALVSGDIPSGTLVVATYDGTQFVLQSLPANAIDSSVVSYVPAGTGAVTTTVQAKLRQTVSVKDFGAVGDGVTDDTAAIQAAIDSVKINGGTVFVPPGTYLINAPIVLWSNVTFYGVKGASTISKPTTTTYTGLSTGLAKSAVIYLDAASGDTSNSIVKGLNLFGEKTITIGVYLGNSNKIVLEDINTQSVLTGISGKSNFLISMKQVRVNSVAFAFDFSSADDKTSLHFDSCYAEACGGGWNFTASRYSSLTNCAADYINTGGKPGNPYGSAAGGNYLTQGYVYVFSASDVVLNGCGCESSTATYIYAESSNVTLNSCRGYLIENYFGATTYITAFIQLRGVTPSNVVLNACSFSQIQNQSGVTTQYVKGIYCETPSVQKFVATTWPVVTGYGAGYDYQNLGHTVPNLLSTYAQENNINTTGTWIPTFSSSTGAFGSISYSSQVGRYAIIGDMVIANFSITISAVTIGTAGGALQISGLPFTVSNAQGQANFRDVFVSQGPDFLQYSGVGTNILLRYKTATSYTNVPPTAIQANSMLQGTITYFL